ncbi:MAG: cytochrome c, partial [Planctomycetes bacterium]|nr:cytochrome c [Planctomycetota bacterium]
CVKLYFKQHPSGIPTDFIVIGDRFRNSIQALVREAKDGREDEVGGEYVKVKATCKDCHNLFKEEE